MIGLRRGLLVILAASAALLAAAGPAWAGRVEVVVELKAPGLADALTQSRALSAHARSARLELRSTTSVAYERLLARAQRSLERRITAAVPQARFRWHYRVVLDGIAVTVPSAQVARLARLPGVAQVYPSLRYHPLLNETPTLIGAPAVWGPDLSTAGNGIKIGIVDEGVDQTHPFFSPAGFAMPAGFPKGNTAFTTAKVIVARAFAPASPKWKYADLPFDPEFSEHGTHVGGIAAGDNGTTAAVPGRGNVCCLSGIAPRAYLGNYKVLTIPTECCGLDGNSPEIAAGVEAAVRDGMDVINLSLGEPEIVDPSRDLVVKAIDGAAAAGVIPAIAAGNDFDVYGDGSVGSPGSAPAAITVAAATKGGVISTFSSGGPSPVSLTLKPDVAAPGVGVLSSVPGREGFWASFDGTSMASPHVAGAAAVLRQRHPGWTVQQIKSALVLTGLPVYTSPSLSLEEAATREGGGLINLPRADNPLVFAQPTNLDFGLLKAGGKASRSVDLTDAGGGAGAWTATVHQQSSEPGVSFTVPPQLTVPGTLELSVTSTAGADERDLIGFVVLTRGPDSRRIPYWLRIEKPRLPGDPSVSVKAPGTYQGDTRGRPARVSSYLYPDVPTPGISSGLAGPEEVVRFRLTRSVANFGVAVVERAPGAAVTPRIVIGNDENRLAGYAGLPVALNPYLRIFQHPAPVASAIAPRPGLYEIVFDSSSARTAGAFTFRFWVNDTTPPRVRLQSRTVAGGKLTLTVTDSGAGVDPNSVFAAVDGKQRLARLSGAVATVSVGNLSRGRHVLSFQASDYQEAKNMENVGPILPNTSALTTTFTVG